jgi:20S proteasome subunit beta 4
MDSVFGLVGDGFAIVAADASAARSILVFKHDEDKIVHLDSHKLLVGAGTPADSSAFNEYISKNMKLYELNNDVKLGTQATANYIRNELATALRKGPYQTNLLLGGYDSIDGVSLYTMDYLAYLSKVNFGAHGYAASFVLSVFDRDWKKGMTLDQGLDVIRKCIHELKTRFLISQPVFVIKVVDQNGIKIVTL